MIKNIVFDLGGVVFEIDKNQAVRRFNEVGFEDAASFLDSFAQVGIFGDLESGKITAEQFRLQLSELAGKQLSMDDCAYGWQGYVVNLPQRNLDKFIELRQRGYHASSAAQPGLQGMSALQHQSIYDAMGAQHCF